jgi:hypothetical protein
MHVPCLLPFLSQGPELQLTGKLPKTWSATTTLTALLSAQGYCGALPRGACGLVWGQVVHGEFPMSLSGCSSACEILETVVALVASRVGGFLVWRRHGTPYAPPTPPVLPVVAPKQTVSRPSMRRILPALGVSSACVASALHAASSPAGKSTVLLPPSCKASDPEDDRTMAADYQGDDSTPEGLHMMQPRPVLFDHVVQHNPQGGMWCSPSHQTAPAHNAT